MNCTAINSGCHFPAWSDGMVHWPYLVPQAPAAGCSQTWVETGAFALILHLKPPGAFCFECDQTPTGWGDFLLSGSHLLPENTLRREVLNSLEIRDNLPVIVTGVRSSLKQTCGGVQEQKTLLYHPSGCPQYEKCSLFCSSIVSWSFLWALPDNENQYTDIYLKCVC